MFASMSSHKTEGESRNQNEVQVDKLSESALLEFHTLNTEFVKIQEEYYNYKMQPEVKLSALQAENNQFRTDAHASGIAIHKLYQEMSEVLVQNRKIGENNHKLVAENEEFENKIAELEQSESRLQAQVSVKCLEFSEEKQKLLSELNYIETSNVKLLSVLNAKINTLEEDIQKERKRMETLQLEFTKVITEKYKLELIFRKLGMNPGGFTRRLEGKVYIGNDSKGKTTVAMPRTSSIEIGKISREEGPTKIVTLSDSEG